MKTDLSKESLIAIQNRLTVISRKVKIMSKADIVQELRDFASLVEGSDVVDSGTIEGLIKICIDMCKPPYYMLEFPTAMQLAVELGMSYQSLMRRMADTEYKSYSGLKKAIRNNIVEQLLVEGIDVKDAASAARRLSLCGVRQAVGSAPGADRRRALLCL